MDPEAARILLNILIENAARILRAYFGVDRAEGAFFEVIDLLREERVLKGYFLERVDQTLAQRDKSGLGEGSVPRELIELAAHELRWPEFKELAEKRLHRFFHGDRSLAASDTADSISAAFDDSWEDREFYKRYGRVKPGHDG